VYLQNSVVTRSFHSLQSYILYSLAFKICPLIQICTRTQRHGDILCTRMSFKVNEIAEISRGRKRVNPRTDSLDPDHATTAKAESCVSICFSETFSQIKPQTTNFGFSNKIVSVSTKKQTMLRVNPLTYMSYWSE